MYTIGFAHSLNPKNANGFMSNQTLKKKSLGEKSRPVKYIPCLA